MRSWISLVLLFNASVPVAWGDANLHIYEQNAKYEAKIAEFCSSSDDLACYRKQKARLKKKGVLRGSAEYARRHYLSLSDEALDKKYKALYQLKSSANHRLNSVKPGEVSISGYQEELDVIAEEWMRRHGTHLVPTGCRPRFPNHSEPHKFLICDNPS